MDFVNIHREESVISRKRKKVYGVQDPIEKMCEDWFGAGETREITRYLPGAVPLATSIKQILGTQLSPDNIKFLEITEKWENLTGKHISDYANPSRMQDGILYVKVENSVMMMELRLYSKKKILDKIRGIFGKNFCSDIKFFPAG